jgi:hypothetical protein
MSFHKRYYTWNKIKEYSKTHDFKEFDMWISKPDAHILQDNESNDFFKAYFCFESDDSREILLDCLKTESEDFIRDIVKCINVIMDKRNQDSHKGSIEIYHDLFMVKWDILAERYKSLIQIK